MAQQALNNLARGAIGIGAAASLAQASLFNVDGGFRAVMFNRLQGVQVSDRAHASAVLTARVARRMPQRRVLCATLCCWPSDKRAIPLISLVRVARWSSQKGVIGEGTHFRIPWLQTPHLFDVRIKPRNISSSTGTKDLQVVTINLRVLSRPDEEFLPDIFSSLGLDYDERVLPSIGNEVLKAVVAQYNAEALITKRETVSHEVRTALTKRANEFHIKLDDVAITDLKFGKEFTSAIESKQVAEQDAERARFLVEKAEQEKKAAIIRVVVGARHRQQTNSKSLPPDR